MGSRGRFGRETSAAHLPHASTPAALSGTRSRRRFPLRPLSKPTPGDTMASDANRTPRPLPLRSAGDLLSLMSRTSSDLAAVNLLIVEIGNSHVALASVIRGDVGAVQRMGLDETAEFEAALEPMWESLPANAPRAAVMGSVVPRMSQRLRELIFRTTGDLPRVVGDQLPLPLPVALEDPHAVGADRVCAAAAAYDRCRCACAVASFGTATTIDCVNNDGVFLGGAILPGLTMQTRALHEGTAKLPLVELRPTNAIYGANTHEAISIGVLHGAVGALREIVERYASDLKHWPQLVVTGGFGPLIAESCEFVDALVPNLALLGIALAYRRAAERAAIE